MATMREYSERSAHVAPLHIHQGHSCNSSSDMTSNSGSFPQNDNGSEFSGYGCNTQITPPATPNGSEDVRMSELGYPQPIFHNFLRAIYPFHRIETASESTVTLPLNQGDVVLVHSIQANGWADGTLLLNGARGWIPTNYCENYEPEVMRSLLKALLSFWDLLQSGITADDEIFSNQEFMRGIIAGVRFLLVSVSCFYPQR
jgi:hypothetical protein